MGSIKYSEVSEIADSKVTVSYEFSDFKDFNSFIDDRSKKAKDDLISYYEGLKENEIFSEGSDVYGSSEDAKPFIDINVAKKSKETKH